MAQRLPSKFESYLLTEGEAKDAMRLTTLNRMFIQNLLSALYERRVALELDVNNVMSFVQQEAAIKSEIIAYTYLLDCDDTVNKKNVDVQM